MRILWAKSGGVLPLDNGGKIRSFNIARELARRHDVTLFTFYPELTPDPHAELGEPFEQIERISLDVADRASLRDVLSYAGNAFTTRPYQIRKYCRPEVVRRLREFLLRKQHEIVVCDFLVTAGVLPWDTGVPTVIFTHNVETLIWRRHVLLNHNLLWRLAAWREHRTIARAERRFTKLADHVLTVSDNDRSSFIEFLPKEKVTTIPTGVDLEYFRPVECADTSRIVFTGSMDWKPNEDAILYFVREILPAIQREIPEVVLSVVGRKPSARLLALSGRNAAIQVTGAVDDIRPYIREASVYIVPLRIGGGTRIKIFEAMAMGKAVVSTSIGAEGLPVSDGEDILLADSPAEFARRTIGLLKDPAMRQRMGCSARALVESQYGWDKVTDVVEQVLLEVRNTRGAH